MQTVQYNCKDFRAYLLRNQKLLGKKIMSTAKYGWAEKENEGGKQGKQ